MNLRARLKRIEKKLPRPGIKIIVHKDGDLDIPDDWDPDIIVSGDEDLEYIAQRDANPLQKVKNETIKRKARQIRGTA